MNAVAVERGFDVRACVEAALTPHEWAAIPGARTLPAGAPTRALLERWERIVAGRAGAGGFERRLAALGLDRERALAWLAPHHLPPDALLPEWSRVLERVAMGPPERVDAGAWAVFPPRERRAYGLDETREPQFPEWLEGFVAHAMRRLTPRALSSLEPGPEPRATLARAMLVRFSRLASRVLSREIERRPAEATVSHGDVLEVLRRHPALARLLAEQAIAVPRAFSELLEHALDDRRALGVTYLGGEDPGGVESVIAWRSDAHHGARTAAFVRFTAGLRLVYKPRDHHIDLAFAAFAAEAARHGAPALRLPRTLARGGHGWSEHVDAGDCDDAAGVTRFWQRQGANAALMHFLCAMDFHYENFIPWGEWPVPVDLEAVLALGRHLPEPAARALPPHLAPIGMTSVLATSIGPYWRAGQGDQGLFVASGLGGCGERLWPEKMPVWEGEPGRPVLRWRRRRYHYDANLPRLAGVPMALDAAAIEAVVEGFRRAYDAVAAAREELARVDGALDAFCACTNRVVLRDTAEYASILFFALAPDHLASGADYAVAMEVLTGELPQYDNLPEAVVLAEDRACCLAQDIPAWHGRPGSRDLVAPSGARHGPAAAESPIEQSRARLARAGSEDRDFQAQLLRSALLAARLSPLDEGKAAPAPELHALTGWGALALASAPAAAASPHEAALGFARETGDTLCDVAMRWGGGAAWLGLTRMAGSPSQLAPIIAFPWTASGAAGTAVLFANLHRAFGEAAHAGLARAALAHFERTHELVRSSPWWPRVLLSAYSGVMFPVYANLEAGRLLEDPRLADRALELALQVDVQRFSTCENPDWLGGAAGAMATLLALHEARPDPRVRERVMAALQAIERAAIDHGRRGFRVPGFQRPLLGMAHGAAGIGLACARVDAVFGVPRARAIALNAFAHEREGFDAEAGDWPDLRFPRAEGRFMTGWCGGPAGAGLARLLVREVLPQAVEAGELEAAAGRTRDRLGVERHHACCGEAGRILFLAEAGRRGDAVLGRAALDAAAGLARFHSAHGFLRQQEFGEAAWTAGLLDGAAGMALAALAAARPGHSNPLSLGSIPG